MQIHQDIKDAATILLYRQQPDVEFFMVKRHAKSSFMANAMVFPGGQVEKDDRGASWLGASDLEEEAILQYLAPHSPELATALLVAAVRETFEEAGVLLANAAGQPLDSSAHAVLTAGRRRLNTGETDFATLVSDFRLTLNFSALRYLSRWVTPPIAKRRFDARFFIARFPEGQRASPDMQETSEGAWIRPEDALQNYTDGLIELAPPTLRILLEFAKNPGLVSGPQASDIQTMAPQPFEDKGEFSLLLPGDPDYTPAGDQPNRITRRDDRWVSIGRGY